MRQCSVIERFYNKIQKVEECWIWTGCRVKGYGQFSVKNKKVYAHRWSYQNMVGFIPYGLQIDHLCRNRACVNPEHLEPVTCQENIRRIPEDIKHNVGVWQKNKTHCSNGHSFDENNTRLTSQGRRCKRCHNDRRKKNRRKHAELPSL